MPAFIYDLDCRSRALPELLLPGRFSNLRSIDGAAASVVAYCDRADEFVSAYMLPMSVPKLSSLLRLQQYEEKVLAKLCTQQRRIARVGLKGYEAVDISPQQDGSKHLAIQHPFAYSHDVRMPFHLSSFN